MRFHDNRTTSLTNVNITFPPSPTLTGTNGIATVTLPIPNGTQNGYQWGTTEYPYPSPCCLTTGGVFANASSAAYPRASDGIGVLCNSSDNGTYDGGTGSVLAALERKCPTENGGEAHFTLTYDLADVPILGIADSFAYRGSTGSFRVSLSRAVTSPVIAHWRTESLPESDPTRATPPQDYQPVADGTLTIPAGGTSTTVSVVIPSNATVNRRFLVVLSNPTNAAIQVRSATGTIVDDLFQINPIALTMGIGDASAYRGTMNMEFVVGANLSSTGPTVTANYKTYDGTGSTGAKAGVDYQYAEGLVELSPSKPSTTIYVPMYNPNTTGEKSFTVVLSNPSGVAIGKGTGIGTIKEIFPYTIVSPTIGIGDASAVRTDPYIDFVVGIANAPSTGSYTLNWRTVPPNTASSAQPDVDYTAVYGIVTVSSTQPTTTVRVNLLNLSTTNWGTLENKTFMVELYDPPTDSTIWRSTGVGTIRRY